MTVPELVRLMFRIRTSSSSSTADAAATRSRASSGGLLALLVTGTDLNALLQLLQAPVSIGTQQQCLCQLHFLFSFLRSSLFVQGAVTSP